MAKPSLQISAQRPQVDHAKLDAFLQGDEVRSVVASAAPVHEPAQAAAPVPQPVSEPMPQPAPVVQQFAQPLAPETSRGKIKRFPLSITPELQAAVDSVFPISSYKSLQHFYNDAIWEKIKRCQTGQDPSVALRALEGTFQAVSDRQGDQ